METKALYKFITIRDDERKKITLKEFRDLIYELREEACKIDILYGYLSDKTQRAYRQGHIDAFEDCLDLLEHIEV